jgi:hypothetical protein
MERLNLDKRTLKKSKSNNKPRILNKGAKGSMDRTAIKTPIKIGAKGHPHGIRPYTNMKDKIKDKENSGPSLSKMSNGTKERKSRKERMRSKSN